MESADYGQRTLSLDPGECTKGQRTQPQTIKCPPMHIRSARIANEGVSISGEHTPVNPSLPLSQSPRNNSGTPLSLHQAINNLILSARQQRHCLQQEVSIDSLQRAILHPTSTPVPVISVIVAEGSLVEPQSTFADAVKSLSPSAMQTGSSSALNTISQSRAATSESTNQPQPPSASTAATTPIRRTDAR